MGDILFLAHRSPFPPDRGDKIRAYNVLKYLAARKRVHLLAFADDPRDLKQSKGLVPLTASRSIIWRSKSRPKALIEALAQRKPASLTAFDNRVMHDAVADILARCSIDTIYVFSGQMAQYLPAKTRARVVMDFCDMDSLKFADYAKGSRGPMRWLMRREANLLFEFERRVAQRVDASLFVSEAEANLFRTRTGAANVQAVENGIDTDFFDPAAAFERIGAPWIDARDFCAKLNREGLPGVFFREAYFQPTFHKFAGRLCNGAQFHVTDRKSFLPWWTTLAILNLLREDYGDHFKWKEPPYEYEHTKLPIEILIGGALDSVFPEILPGTRELGFKN